MKRKLLFNVLWIMIALSTMVLTGFAIHARNNNLCNSIKVEILNKEIGAFVTEKEIIHQIDSIASIATEQKVKNINTQIIEKVISNNPWVYNVDVFFDNERNLQLEIIQRKPIAKLFNAYTTSHYIDENGFRMPTKLGAAARVLIVTGFTSENEVLAKVDSALLTDVTTLCKHIIKDSFLNAQIAQVNINPNGRFELVSNFGDHTIQFGDIKSMNEKFNNLKLFYQKAWLQNGMNTYEQIDVRYKGQVVCTKRGYLNAIKNADSVLSNTATLDSLLLPVDSATIIH